MDYGEPGFAIHSYHQWPFKLHVHKEITPLNGGLPNQPIHIHEVCGGSIGYCEVAHVHSHQVVEEMRSLAGFHDKIRQSGFQYYFSAIDLGSANRDAQEFISGAPSSWSDQDVVLVLVFKF